MGWHFFWDVHNWMYHCFGVFVCPPGRFDKDRQLVPSYITLCNRITQVMSEEGGPFCVSILPCEGLLVKLLGVSPKAAENDWLPLPLPIVLLLRLQVVVQPPFRLALFALAFPVAYQIWTYRGGYNDIHWFGLVARR